MSNKTFIQIGVVVLIVFVFVAFANNIDRAIGRWFGNDEKEPDYGPTPVPPGSVSPSFDVDYHVSRLWQLHADYLIDASPRCRAYKDLMRLNDTEFVIVTNTYLEDTGRSLRSAMDATVQSGCSFFGTAWNNRVLERMRTLNVRG